MAYFHFFALVSSQIAALSSALHHAMLPEFSGKWRAECLNTKLPLPTLLQAGYSVNIKEMFKTIQLNLLFSKHLFIFYLFKYF